MRLHAYTELLPEEVGTQQLQSCLGITLQRPSHSSLGSGGLFVSLDRRSRSLLSLHQFRAIVPVIRLRMRPRSSGPD